METLVILGASGSIGKKVVNLLINKQINYQLTGLSVGKNINELHNILNKFQTIKYVYCLKKEDTYLLKKTYKNINFYSNDELTKFIEVTNADFYVNALVGFAGVFPTFKILELNKDLALANKESIVVGLDLFKKKLKQSKSNLYPIDSEHVAIEKLLKGNKKDLKEIILTCSGGPFLFKNFEELNKVTKKEALNHPNWKMGEKITIDSATLINKMFEVIEAYYLFNVSLSKIKVIIQKESLVHSIIKLKDNNYLFDFGFNDMTIPISYALNKNNRILTNVDYDLNNLKNLTFLKLNDFQKKVISYSKLIINKNGNMGAIVNAANEFGVSSFLNNKIKFTQIYDMIDKAILYIKYIKFPTLEDLKKTHYETINFLNNYLIKEN